MNSTSTSTKDAIWIMGIDPGLSGGIAFITQVAGGTKLHVETHIVPVMRNSKTNRKSIDPWAMANLIKHYNPILAVIEEVHAMPKQGVVSMFTFGKGFGIVLGVCTALQIPIKMISPPEWKRRLGLTKKEYGGTVSIVKSWFPEHNFKTGRSQFDHEGMIDATAIALSYAKEGMENVLDSNRSRVE